jgi:hypothetical protein
MQQQRIPSMWRRSPIQNCLNEAAEQEQRVLHFIDHTLTPAVRFYCTIRSGGKEASEDEMFRAVSKVIGYLFSDFRTQWLSTNKDNPYNMAGGGPVAIQRSCLIAELLVKVPTPIGASEEEIQAHTLEVQRQGLRSQMLILADMTKAINRLAEDAETSAQRKARVGAQSKANEINSSQQMPLGVPDEQQPHLEVSPHGTARTKDIMDRKRKHSEGRGVPSEELPPIAMRQRQTNSRDLVDTDDRLGFDRPSYLTVASKPKAEPPVCQFTPPKFSRRGTATMINNTRNSTIGQPLQKQQVSGTASISQARNVVYIANNALPGNEAAWSNHRIQCKNYLIRIVSEAVRRCLVAKRGGAETDPRLDADEVKHLLEGQLQHYKNQFLSKCRTPAYAQEAPGKQADILAYQLGYHVASTAVKKRQEIGVVDDEAMMQNMKQVQLNAMQYQGNVLSNFTHF